MALTGKKYEKFYATTGSGDDKVKSDTLTQAEAFWDGDRASGCKDLLEDFTLGPIVFQLQQMQDEIDYLRTEISNNKDKATFPGLGTSASTALAGNTTTISTAQANAITANTAKVSMVIGTGKGEAMSGQTNIPTVTVNSGKNIEVLFDNLKIGQKSTTIDLLVTDTSTKKTYTATITLT
jgi:hypothetical protein